MCWKQGEDTGRNGICSGAKWTGILKCVRADLVPKWCCKITTHDAIDTPRDLQCDSWITNILVKRYFTGAHQGHETSNGILFGERERGLVLETEHSWDSEPEFALLILGQSDMDYEMIRKQERVSVVSINSCVVHPSFNRVQSEKNFLICYRMQRPVLRRIWCTCRYCWSPLAWMFLYKWCCNWTIREQLI